MSKEESDILEKLKDKNYIVFINKNDLESKIVLQSEVDVVYGNTIKENGLDALKNKISEIFALNEIPKKDFTYISNARQLSLMKLAKDSIDSAIIATKEDVPVDLIEIDITNARNYLGEIIGETYSDELIDELFSRFCLGK